MQHTGPLKPNSWWDKRLQISDLALLAEAILLPISRRSLKSECRGLLRLPLPSEWLSLEQNTANLSVQLKSISQPALVHGAEVTKQTDRCTSQNGLSKRLIKQWYRGLSTLNLLNFLSGSWERRQTLTASALKFVWLTVSMAVCIKEKILFQTLYPCELCFALKHQMWRWMFCEVWSSALHSARCVSHQENHCGGDWDFNIFHRLRCGVNLTHMASGFNHLFLALPMMISPVSFFPLTLFMSILLSPPLLFFSSKCLVSALTATWEYAVKTLTYN